MEWTRLFLGFLGDISWPLATIIIVVILKKEIGALVRLLRRIKYKEMEAEFGELIEATETEFRESKLGFRVIETKPEPIEERRFLSLATSLPIAAIIDAWKDIEVAVAKIRELRADESAPRNDYEFMVELRHEGILDPATHKVYKYLQRLRNEAVHTRDPDAISVGEAIKYRDLTRHLAAQLERVGQQST